MKSRASNPFLTHLSTLAALVAAPVAHAVDGTWVGNANWWSDPASWVGGTTPDGPDGTANFTGVNITGNINKPLGGTGQNRTIGNIIFTDATTSSHNLTLSANTLTLDVTSGQPNIDVTQSDRTLTISSVVAGNDGLQKSGLGTLTLNNANTFTGNITISAGTLSANFNGGGAANPTATALGNTQTAGRTATISSGATLRFNIADVMGNGGGTPLLTIIANGGTVLNGGNFINSLGPVQLNGGTLNSSGTGDGFKLTGTVTVGGSAVSTIQANASGFVGSSGVITYDVADAVAGSGSDLNVTARLSGIFGSGGVTKTGAGTMTLSNQNTYTGLTRIDAGTLALGHATNTIADTGAVNVNGGTLALGTNTDTVGAVTLTSGSITGSGAGKLTGTGSNFDVRSGTISAKIGGTVGLDKTTGGTVTISSDNSSGGYTGATSVSAGVLAVDGALANTSTTISGTGTLQGSGSIAGSVSVLSGGTLAPGNSIESLGVSALSFATGSTYAYELQTNLFAGTPNVSADLTFSSGTLDIAAGSILTLTDLATSTALAINSKLTLISYFGGWTSAELFTYLGNTLDDGDTFTLGANIWEFNYDDATGGPNYASNQSGATRFVTITVVPEPRAALLGGLGMLALLRRRRH